MVENEPPLLTVPPVHISSTIDIPSSSDSDWTIDSPLSPYVPLYNASMLKGVVITNDSDLDEDEDDLSMALCSSFRPPPFPLPPTRTETTLDDTALLEQSSAILMKLSTVFEDKNTRKTASLSDIGSPKAALPLPLPRPDTGVSNNEYDKLFQFALENDVTSFHSFLNHFDPHSVLWALVTWIEFSPRVKEVFLSTYNQLTYTSLVFDFVKFYLEEDFDGIIDLISVKLESFDDTLEFFYCLAFTFVSFSLESKSVFNLIPIKKSLAVNHQSRHVAWFRSKMSVIKQLITDFEPKPVINDPVCAFLTAYILGVKESIIFQSSSQSIKVVLNCFHVDFPPPLALFLGLLLNHQHSIVNQITLSRLLDYGLNLPSIYHFNLSNFLKCFAETTLLSGLLSLSSFAYHSLLRRASTKADVSSTGLALSNLFSLSGKFLVFRDKIEDKVIQSLGISFWISAFNEIDLRHVIKNDSVVVESHFKLVNIIIEELCTYCYLCEVHNLFQRGLDNLDKFFNSRSQSYSLNHAIKSRDQSFLILYYHKARLLILKQDYSAALNIISLVLSNQFLLASNNNIILYFKLLLISIYNQFLCRNTKFDKEIVITPQHCFSSKLYLLDCCLATINEVNQHSPLFMEFQRVRIKAAGSFLSCIVLQSKLLTPSSDLIESKLSSFDVPLLSSILTYCSGLFCPLKYCRCCLDIVFIFVFKNYIPLALHSFKTFCQVFFKYFLISFNQSIVSIANFPEMYRLKVQNLLLTAVLVIVLLVQKEVDVIEFLWIFDLLITFDDVSKAHCDLYKSHCPLYVTSTTFTSLPTISTVSKSLCLNFWISKHIGNVRQTLWTLLSIGRRNALFGSQRAQGENFKLNSFKCLDRYLLIMSALRSYVALGSKKCVCKILNMSVDELNDSDLDPPFDSLLTGYLERTNDDKNYILPVLDGILVFSGQRMTYHYEPVEQSQPVTVNNFWFSLKFTPPHRTNPISFPFSNQFRLFLNGLKNPTLSKELSFLLFFDEVDSSPQHSLFDRSPEEIVFLSPEINTKQRFVSLIHQPISFNGMFYESLSFDFDFDVCCSLLVKPQKKQRTTKLPVGIKHLSLNELEVESKLNLVVIIPFLDFYRRLPCLERIQSHSDSVSLLVIASQYALFGSKIVAENFKKGLDFFEILGILDAHYIPCFLI
ncbi:hypothetical protein P9112_004163 [Eukaryota sp. TZLM1-RC]